MDLIEKQALFFGNYHLIHPEYKATIHLEDKEDEPFWNTQIQRNNPGKYNFVYHSKNNKGSESKGCTQCLKYKGYLSKRFFVCIDSDLRLLRGEFNINATNFISQTYTYSWENHYCEATHLQQRLPSNIESKFDFRIFLSSLSNIIHKPLLFLIQCHSNELNAIWNISKFNQCVPTQPTSEEIKDNGISYLQKVSDNFNRALNGLELIKTTEINGIDTGNAYLHIQGHLLYKLVLHIGTMLCKGSNIAFKSEILDTATHTDGYDEINSLQSDLEAILS